VEEERGLDARSIPPLPRDQCARIHHRPGPRVWTGANLLCIGHSRIISFIRAASSYIHLLFAELAKSLTSAIPWQDGKWNGLDLNQVIERYIFGSPNDEDAARMKLMILEWPPAKEWR
jgi:hypothetical protein